MLVTKFNTLLLTSDVFGSTTIFGFGLSSQKTSQICLQPSSMELPKNQKSKFDDLKVSEYITNIQYSLQQTTWHLSTKYQNGKIAEEVRLSTVLLSYVKRKSWDRLFRSGGSHFIYCSQLWASSLPENLCCCLDLDLLQHNRRILRFFSNSIFCLSWFGQKQKKT